MKKLLSGFVLSLIGGPILSSMLFAAAMVCATEARAQRAGEGCSITYAADDDMKDTIRRLSFIFDGYDSLCARLRAEKMGIDITSAQGVLTDRAFGWATVHLYHIGINIPGFDGIARTILDRDPSSPSAQQAAWKAVNNTLADIAADPQPYIDSVFRAERDAAERLAKAKASRP